MHQYKFHQEELDTVLLAMRWIVGDYQNRIIQTPQSEFERNQEAENMNEIISEMIATFNIDLEGFSLDLEQRLGKEVSDLLKSGNIGQIFRNRNEARANDLSNALVSLANGETEVTLRTLGSLPSEFRQAALAYEHEGNLEVADKIKGLSEEIDDREVLEE